MKHKIIVSIIFPNYNGGNEPLECLKSIYAMDFPKSTFEVIVVDNHSTDGSDKKIVRQFPQVHLLRNPRNKGFASAINTGIKAACGKYIFIGNDDIVFAKNSLRLLIQYLNRHPKVGIIGGKILYKNRPREIASSGYMMNRWSGDVYIAPQPGKTKEPDWIQGCALLVSKKVLQKIGLLDEGFSMIYFEDFDLCLRAEYAGFKIIYIPEAEFKHGVTTTMNKNKPEKYYQWYKNKLRFILKHFSWYHICSIFFLQFFLVFPYRMLILRDGRSKPFLKGILWNIKNIKQTLQSRFDKKSRIYV